jgi:hypothetical protein
VNELELKISTIERVRVQRVITNEMKKKVNISWNFQCDESEDILTVGDCKSGFVYICSRKCSIQFSSICYIPRSLYMIWDKSDTFHIQLVIIVNYSNKK